MFGQLVKQQGKDITVRLSDSYDIFKAARLSGNKSPTVEVDIADQRHISPDQRRKIWALINDFCRYTGDVPHEAEEYFKAQVQAAFGIEYFHLSNCSVTTANYMIVTILDFLFREDIPFRTKVWDSLDSDYLRAVLSIRNRVCVICGKPHAQLAHYKTVGIGRNRRMIDERQMYFMSLCPDHHQQQHRIGIITFLQRYHIKPIKLTNDQLINYHILSKQRLRELENA